jgi:hypothetical protein
VQKRDDEERGRAKKRKGRGAKGEGDATTYDL